MFESILKVTETGATTASSSLLCLAAAIILGITAALFYMIKNTTNKSFVVTLALLPALVQVVILMVNGNLGAGVAVMGAFSLVRFRSVPGSAREISAIFLAMAIGLATGMGSIGFAAVFTVILCCVQTVLLCSPFGTRKSAAKELRITIPENLDYTGLFDDIFKSYTSDASLEKVRTAGMGSVYELHYHITLKDEQREKAFIDAIRCRNGNMAITCGHASTVRDEL
ncbi:MAG: DUF4956 domain-containing protein [Ruminococcaceae bacterium]|nr:DUF4956 domain-containing protein [Oscillospiraceae bacterium]